MFATIIRRISPSQKARLISVSILLTLAILYIGFSLEMKPVSALTNAGSITALGSPLTENFDSLAQTGTGIAWTDNVTIPGWYSTRTTYNTGTGSSNTGALYSFGVAGTNPATDRALGSVASGTTTTVYQAARLTNNTGTTITSLNVAYTGEQWRNGGNVNVNTLTFQYQVANAGTITGANAPTTGWTTFSALNFNSPITGATAATLDGNAPANRTAISANLPVTVNSGQEIWLRWQDPDDAGSDHGLAIDDFSVTAQGATASPSPTVVPTATPTPTPTPIPTPTPAPTPTPGIPGSIVVSQVYGGGGCGTAGCSTYNNDYIELFNHSSQPVSLAGWSVQYASATGTGSWSVTPLTSVNLQPGQYYLVQESGNANGVNSLPTPDAIDTSAMAAGAGKVLVASTTTAFNGQCPSGVNLIDLVGYGSTANCSETSPAPAPSTTAADLRATDGCTDTNNNSADFTAGAPNPRNTSSPLNKCVVPIATSCPGSITTLVGTAASANVSASDADGTVTSATITSPAVSGITLDNFVPAASVGGTATATLNVANTTAAGSYSVTIQYANNDSPTPQTATCSVLITVNPQPSAFNSAIKISQVYGGGGNSGSTYTKDFIELYNTSTSQVDISGWSVQYTGATAAFAAQTAGPPPTPLTTVIPANTIMQPGTYYLIQEAPGAGGTTSPPTADLIGGIMMGGTAGKVALVASSIVLSGGDTTADCPTSPLIVDFVGYGPTATCSETSPTAVLSATTAAIRKNNGCTDSNNNFNDFLVDGPIPRNSALPPHGCGGDPTQLYGSGLATPDSVLPASNSLLTVTVTPASAPPSSGISVTGDLTSIGLSNSQQFYDDGTHGDATAGDNVFSYLATVGAFVSTGAKNITTTITDAQPRSASAPITMTVQSPTCGVERWSVKTGSDPDAPNVDLNNPVPTTIANLRSLTPPTTPPDNARVAPTEDTVYVIRATMTLYKLETDVDYHIVVQDDNGNTMVTEIPCPCCVAVGSPFTAGIANARQEFDSHLSATPIFQSVSIPVQITGVAFFDFIHGQTGVAPNGIELHPILDIKFLSSTTTSLASSINPSQFGQSVQFTATVNTAGSNTPTGNVTFSDGSTVIAATSLNGSGQASFNTTSLSVGSHSITASYPGDSNSLASSSSAVVQVVNKADQSITFNPIPGKTFGDADFAVNAAASSGLPVSFSIQSGPATISGNVVHITGAGTVTVRASQAGNGNYNPAPDADQSFDVAKASQSISFAALGDKTYGDPPFTVSATGGGSGNPVTFAASGNCTSGGANGSTITITGAGSCTVTASQGGNPNYNAAADVARTFTINQATATITVNGYSETYDANAHGATGSATGVHGEDLSSLLNLGASFTDVPGGTAHWTFTGNANYAAAAGDVSITIAKASSTTAVTCPASVTYTGASLTPCSVVVTGVNLSLTPAANYANNINAGTATSSYTYAGDVNHDGSSNSKNFEITKAASTTTVTCPASETFTGSAITPCSVTVTGANLSLTPGANYVNNTNVGTATASYTYAGDANHDGSSDSKNFEITKASSITTVNCPASQTYTGSAIEPCTATATGVGGLNQSVTVLYANNTNVGSATASATYGGDANHDGSTGNGGFTITRASSTTTVTCPASATYTGSAIEPCTATATGAGLNQSVTVLYANNTNVGSATASATFGGDANHDGSTGNGGFTITRASSTTTVTCPASATYTGSAIEPCNATVTGVGGLNQAVTPVTYTNNTNSGSATADATYAGDANHEGSTGSSGFTIANASSTTTVSCPASQTYTGSAIQPCTATATGAGGLNQSLTVSYTNNTNAGTATANATFGGDANHAGSAGSATFTITKATPVITWNNPADIVYGTALSSTQLNATANVAGSFSYTPAAGTLLNAGSAQPLLASFSPTDTTNYNATSRNVQINVLKATPAFSNLSSPTIGCHAASTVVSGRITFGTFVPTGNVSITVNSVTQSAAIQPDGTFSSTFATGTLTPANSPLVITYSYGGDRNFNPASAAGTLTIVDTASPTITLNGNSISFWPPNHSYHTVDVSDLVASASDSCDASVNLNSVVISQVTSDEGTAPSGDIVIAANCKSVQLRADRDGGGNGRVYTITFRVRDVNGNSTTATANVTVPHDNGHPNAIDSGAAYTVTSNCP